MNNDDSRELQDLFDQIRHVTKFKPTAPAQLRAAVEVLEKSLPRAELSASAISIAKQLGRDVDQVALMRASVESSGSADQQLLDRMPRERLVMLRAFGGNSVSSQAARARALNWDKNPSANYPAP